MKRICILLLITFSFVSLPQYVFASDFNRSGLTDNNKLQAEAGLFSSQFSAANKNQQDAIAFKNILTVSQAQTTQPPSQQALPQTGPVQYSYQDGTISQTLAGIDFVKIEEHTQVWKGASTTEKLKARLKGKRAHGKYIDVVTSKVVGRAADGSTIGGITLDTQGRVKGYKRTMQQVVEGATYSVTQTVQNITYAAGEDPSAKITNSASVVDNKDKLMIGDIGFDVYGHISSYKATNAQRFLSDSFQITKQVSDTYNKYGGIISHYADTSASALTSGPNMTYVGILADSNLRVVSYVRKVAQSIDGINFETGQIANVDYDKSKGNASYNALVPFVRGKTTDGRVISDIALYSDGFVKSYTEKKVQTISPSIQFTLERKITNISYDSGKAVVSRQEAISPPVVTAPAGVAVSGIETDSLLRVKEFTTSLSQTLDDIAFTVSRDFSVGYNQLNDLTVTKAAAQATATVTDGRTISDVTLDADDRISSYSETRVIGSLNGTDILESSAVTIDRTQPGPPTIIKSSSELSAAAPDGWSSSGVTRGTDSHISGWTEKKPPQSINGIDFAVSRAVSVTYDQQGQGIITRGDAQAEGKTTDGTSIINVTLNPQGLVNGYTQRRTQSLALIQFINDRQISNITYNASDNIAGHDPEVVSSAYTAKSGVTLSSIQVNPSLRVTGYRMRNNQVYYDTVSTMTDANEMDIVYDTSNIAYDTNDKITSLSLDYFQASDITHYIWGDTVQVFPYVSVSTPFLLNGMRAEIYEQFGILVIDTDDSFTAGHLIGIKRVLQDMYPAHLLDEITIIVAKASSTAGNPAKAGWAETYYNNAMRFIDPNKIEFTGSTGDIELYLVHEIAHAIHFREVDSFTATLRSEFQTLDDASGLTEADAINYAGYNPAVIPSYPPYGMGDVFEDFATMMEGWWWNTTNLLSRGIQQFNDLANPILLEKALVLAELFSHVVDGLEYTYTYTLQDIILGDFIRAGSRIIRDATNKIIEIGDILIPAI